MAGVTSDARLGARRTALADTAQKTRAVYRPTLEPLFRLPWRAALPWDPPRQAEKRRCWGGGRGRLGGGVMASGLVPRSHGPAPEPKVVEYCLRTIYLSTILLSVGSLSLSISSSSTERAGTISHIYLYFSIYLTYFMFISIF